MSIVESNCLGKGQCTIPATDGEFGDPCYGTVKRMSIQLEGNCALTGTQVAASIPANTVGEVWLPLKGAAATGANVTVTESQGTVWSNGAFVPGVPGVTAGRFDQASESIVFSVGSGSFSFKDVQSS